MAEYIEKTWQIGSAKIDKVYCKIRGFFYIHTSNIYNSSFIWHEPLLSEISIHFICKKQLAEKVTK